MAVFRQEATQEAAARAWSAAISAALSLPSQNRTCPEQRQLQGKLRGLFPQWLVAASAWLGCHSASDWTLWRSHLYTSGTSANQFFQLIFECSSLPSIQGTPQVVRAPVTPKSQGPDRGDCMNLWCAAKTIMYVMWLYFDPIQYMHVHAQQISQWKNPACLNDSLKEWRLSIAMFDWRVEWRSAQIWWVVKQPSKKQPLSILTVSNPVSFSDDQQLFSPTCHQNSCHQDSSRFLMSSRDHQNQNAIPHPWSHGPNNSTPLRAPAQGHPGLHLSVDIRHILQQYINAIFHGLP